MSQAFGLLSRQRGLEQTREKRMISAADFVFIMQSSQDKTVPCWLNRKCRSGHFIYWAELAYEHGPVCTASHSIGTECHLADGMHCMNKLGWVWVR